MEYKFLYIDDVNSVKAEGTISSLREKGFLNVVHENPAGSWEKQRDRFLKTNFNEDYNGLLLDLRLEDFVNTAGETSYFKGTSLAQELRTLMKEKELLDIPIILLSASNYLKLSFDRTGKDLFDMIIPKESLKGTKFEDVRKKLISLASGYEQLKFYNRAKPIEYVLNILKISEDRLDSRIASIMLDLVKVTTHEIASFIIKQLLVREGVLISENVLAARLGIDYANSPDWNNLLDILASTEYKGVFNSGWRRWWMYDIEGWWNTHTGSISMKQSHAVERVRLIAQFTGLENLTPAKPGPMSKSDKFWTVCVGTERPLDIIEGLLIANQDSLYPWQDRRYICYEEALKRKNPQSWDELASSEKHKLDQIREIHARKRTRR